MFGMRSSARPWNGAQAAIAVCGMALVLSAIGLFAARHPAPAPAMFPKRPAAVLVADVNDAPERAIANASFDHQHYAAAAEAYRRVLAVNPNDVDLHLDLATALWQEHQADDALRELEVVLQLDPDNPLALDRFGTIELFDKHDPVAAAQAFQRLLAVAPNYRGRTRVEALLSAAKNR